MPCTSTAPWTLVVFPNSTFLGWNISPVSKTNEPNPPTGPKLPAKSRKRSPLEVGTNPPRPAVTMALARFFWTNVFPEDATFAYPEIFTESRVDVLNLFPSSDRFIALPTGEAATILLDDAL